MKTEATGRPAASSAPYSVRVVTREDDFLALGQRWSALLAEAEDANNFLSHEWLSCWWRAYRPGGSLRILLVEDADGKLAGIAPLFLRTEKVFGVPCKVLRFIGDGTAETDHMNFLARKTDRAAVVARMLEQVDADPVWDAARLNQLPKPSRNADDLVAWCARKGLLHEVVEAPCPIRRVPKSFDELLGTLQSRFRGKLRSTRKKLEETYRIEFGLHQDPDSFSEALETLYRNHASRWEGKGQKGVFVAEARRAFYRDLTRAFHDRGWLRFYYLKLDGKVIAQEYCFEYEGVIHLLQEGFDYSRSEENVGNALRSYILEWAIREGKTAYDFLAGTSRHKSIWSDGMVPDILVEACRPTWKGRFYYKAPRMLEALKTRVKAFIRKEPAAAAPAPEAEPAEKKPVERMAAERTPAEKPAGKAAGRPTKENADGDKPRTRKQEEA